MEIPWANCARVLLNVLVLLVASSRAQIMFSVHNQKCKQGFEKLSVYLKSHITHQLIPRWDLHELLSCRSCIIRCDCNTAECVEVGKTMCTGTKFCYTELYQNTLHTGCDPAPLACENRKPAGVDVEWPAVYCCHDKDMCNKHAIPTVATAVQVDELQQQHDPQSTDSNCSSPTNLGKSSNTKVINPIYIAVPVAGVCVLLSLIIFAMYLLRRRSDYHHQDSFHHYHHEHATTLSQKQADVLPHHCQCTCKKQTVPQNSKGNRCTDSERSSSGSETKLFLQS